MEMSVMVRRTRERRETPRQDPGWPTPHELRAFLILADELHFGRAAAALGVAQSSLSELIRRLEAKVERRAAGPHVAACGPHARGEPDAGAGAPGAGRADRDAVGRQAVALTLRPPASRRRRSRSRVPVEGSSPISASEAAHSA